MEDFQKRMLDEHIQLVERLSKLNRNITYQVDPETVCKFTGLTDCEGNEVLQH